MVPRMSVAEMVFLGLLLLVLFTIICFFMESL